MGGPEQSVHGRDSEVKPRRCHTAPGDLRAAMAAHNSYATLLWAGDWSASES